MVQAGVTPIVESYMLLGVAADLALHVQGRVSGMG